MILRQFILVSMIYFLSSSSTFALISGEFLFSKRWINVSTKLDKDITLSGWEKKVSLYFDPIPLIPVALGFSYLDVSLSDGFEYKIKSASLNEFNIELMTWLPLFSYTPYLFVSLPVLSELKIDAEDKKDAEKKAKLSGLNLGIGVRKSLIPFVSLILEAGISVAKVDKFDQEKRDFNGKYLGVGVQVGL